jgi:sec-independent protein translocase protein TatC
VNKDRPNSPKAEDTPKVAGSTKEMSFLEHLGELRSVIIQSLVVLLVVSIVCWFFSGRILELLLEDLPLDSLYFHSPIEAFMVRMKISFVLGAMITFPFILFKIWSFVAPGLFENERRKIYPFMIVSSILFYTGVLFCYIVLIPVVLKFLLGFATEHLNPLLSVNSYFAFVARLCFSFGIVFQIPVIVLILSAIGIVTPNFLLRQWRYAVVLIFFVAAVMTPPDVVSQLMMALPVLFLYIGSVLVAYFTVKKQKRSEED